MKPLRTLAVLAAGLAFSAAALAQAWPAKPVRMIVPYPPGGATDILGRLISAKLGPMIGQSVVVENRSGASGNVGFDYVAKSAPDGYTLLTGTANLTIAPAFSSKLPFNVLTDFSPISLIVSSQNFLVVRPGLGVNSVKELVALAKANPGKLTYGSSGIGTPLLSIEILKSLAGIDIVHVPYKGGGPALLALMSGEVAVLFSSQSSTLPQVRAEKLRALAVSSLARSAAAPALPTLAESGVPGFEVTSWYGVLVPAKTPAAVVSKLHAEIFKLLQAPDIKERLTKDGNESVGSTPKLFAAYIHAELEKWAKVIKASGTRSE